MEHGSGNAQAQDRQALSDRPVIERGPIMQSGRRWYIANAINSRRKAPTFEWTPLESLMLALLYSGPDPARHNITASAAEFVRSQVEGEQ